MDYTNFLCELTEGIRSCQRWWPSRQCRSKNASRCSREFYHAPPRRQHTLQWWTRGYREDYQNTVLLNKYLNKCLFKASLYLLDAFNVFLRSNKCYKRDSFAIRVSNITVFFACCLNIQWVFSQRKVSSIGVHCHRQNFSIQGRSPIKAELKINGIIGYPWRKDIECNFWFWDFNVEALSLCMI